MAGNQEAVFKGKQFLAKVDEYAKSDAVRAGKFVVKEMSINYQMYGQLSKIAADPKRAGIILTATCSVEILT